MLLTDTDGVRAADGARIPYLRATEAEPLIADSVIVGGMIPKVRAAVRALVAPESLAVIADGRTDGALAQALSGTERGTRLGTA